MKVYAVIMTTFIAFTSLAVGQDVGGGWTLKEGKGVLETAPPCIRVGTGTPGVSVAVQPIPTSLQAQTGYLRFIIDVTPGTREAGVRFLPETANTFISLSLNRFLGLRVMSGDTVLWQDRNLSWKYYTPYILEWIPEPGRVRVQLVALNGRALLSQSEWIDLPSDFPPIKSVGVYSKDGSARVYPFQWGGEPLYPVMDKAPVKNTEAAPERGSSEQPAAQGLGTGWRILNGTWTWVEAGKVLGCGGGKGESRVLSTDIKGVLGIWHGDIVPSDGTEAVGLLFQADPEQKEGFLCRVTRDKCALETLAGSILWEVSHGALKPGEHVRIDGIVRTDRVSVRITGEKGEVIAVSPERYVSDKNNTRNGFLGFMGENGKVSCEGFSFKTE